MKVDESNYDVLEKVNKIINVDFIKWTDAENIEGYITVYDLYDMLDYLLYQYNVKSEEYDDLLEDLRENYRPISYAEQVGVRDSDFI